MKESTKSSQHPAMGNPGVSDHPLPFPLPWVAFTFMLYALTFIVNNAMNMGMAKISL